MRLKQHRVGARLNLQKEDLLHVTIMPQSINVHTIRAIVTRRGDVEMAEWITGIEGGFSHQESRLQISELKEMTGWIEALCNAENAIDFDRINCDNFKYEGTERVFLRFWCGDMEKSAFLPTPEFFVDQRIDDEKKERFVVAFRKAMSFLPAIG